MSVPLRPASASNIASVRALAISALGDAPHAEPLLDALDNALARESDEYRAIVAYDDDVPAGVIVFGEIAGTRGAGRIHLVAVDATARRRGIARGLIEGACARLGERGGRLVTIELSANVRFADAIRVVRGAGFHEEGRIDGYARDGVPLLLFRRELRA